MSEQARALEENRGSPELLHTLAEVYFGLVSDVEGASPRERLADLLLDDEGRVDTVLRALVLTVERDDLPTEREVLRLAVTRRSHYLSLPLIAGLEEGVAPIENEGRLRVPLTILFNDAAPKEDPKWYLKVVAERPDLVAQVMVKSARHSFRGGGEGAWSLYRLGDDEHGEVADAAVLRSFPTRSTAKQLPLLKMLLRAGLLRRREEAAVLIDAKLGSKSMDVAQRMYWLCAGLLTGKGEFVERLRTALAAGDERRVRHVASFFEGREWAGLMGELGVEALEVLVLSVGASFGPGHRKPGRVYTVTSPMEAEALVREWIERLGACPVNGQRRFSKI